MNLHWSWGLSTALILALVIHLNGKGVRVGWLLGALVQLINLGFGYLVHGQWTFLFLVAPAAMFLVNWWKHPARRRAAPLPQCMSVRQDNVCDRVLDHEGPHVGFTFEPTTGLHITHVWTDDDGPLKVESHLPAEKR